MINKQMIALARDLRGINQLDLADKIGMSRGNIGKIENGDIGVKDDTVELIAKATNLPFSFFEQQNEIYPEHLIYRKRNKVAQSLISPINARVNILRLQIQILLKELNKKKYELPVFEVTETDTPQVIAKKLRNFWELDSPVLDNIIPLLESKGIAVTGFDFGTERVDCRCVLTEDKYPIIIYNSAMLGDKQRFSLIYQLGHLVMHTAFNVGFERDIGHEANLFAAEFLMPEKNIRGELWDNLTLPYLGSLKQKWRVSMIAILYRADDLGFLSSNQRKYLLQQFNEQHIRKREPVELDLPIEKPTMIKSWIHEVMQKHGIDIHGIAKLLHMNTDEFIKLYY